MNIIDTLQVAFPKQDSGAISITEKYSSLTVEYNVKHPLSVEINSLDDLNTLIASGDSLTVELMVENDDPIILTSTDYDIDSFIGKIREANSYLEDEESVKVKLLITKDTTDSIISIYNFTSFLEFCENMSPIDWLNIVCNDLSKNGFLKFTVFENAFDSFWSDNIVFSTDNRELNALSDFTISDNCHFGNYKQYPYNPLYFHLIERPETNNRVTDILDRLTFAFAVISIFDITTLDGNRLGYKLNGYKTIQGSFDIDKVDVESKDVYVKIYNWIYAEKANCTDKIGLTRNIISIYSKDNLPRIDEAVYFSIQSGFKTYLKENLSKYIEIRNKISDQLFEISDRTVKVVENYLSYYQKSSITFVTYFISVFTIRVIITKKFSNVFSKETALIALTLLAVSFGYMIVSLLGVNSEISRLNRKYNNIKRRFKDLLIEEDINKILGDDQEFNDDIAYIKKRRLLYSMLWIGTILLFTTTTCYLSSYVCHKLDTAIEQISLSVNSKKQGMVQPSKHVPTTDTKKKANH